MFIRSGLIVGHMVRVFAKLYGGHIEIGSAEVVQTKNFHGGVGVQWGWGGGRGLGGMGVGVGLWSCVFAYL